jgi:multidrug efflux pump subunit AcrA (membrane-fusion protein)
MARVGAGDRSVLVFSEVEERGLDVGVPFTGRVRALQVAQYGPPQLTKVWDYRLTFIAPEGSVVTAGDPVLRFDTTELEQALRRNQADRDAAATELERRRRDFAAEVSAQELAFEEAKANQRRAEIDAQLPRDLVARSKIEKAEVDLELANNEISHRKERVADLGRRSKTELGILRDRRDRAAAEVAEIERSIELMTVRASSPGTVSHRSDRHGAKKKVGDSCWRGARVIEIPVPGALHIDAWVKESESGALRVGLPATWWLEAHPEQSLTAKVATLQQTVERASELDPGPIVRLELSFAATDGQPIHPGMRVQGRIQLENRPRQVVVRAAAVRPGASGPIVVKKRLLGTVDQPVEVGTRSGDWVEVLSGLEPGDRVVMPR